MQGVNAGLYDRRQLDLLAISFAYQAPRARRIAIQLLANTNVDLKRNPLNQNSSMPSDYIATKRSTIARRQKNDKLKWVTSFAEPTRLLTSTRKTINSM